MTESCVSLNQYIQHMFVSVHISSEVFSLLYEVLVLYNVLVNFTTINCI